MANGKKSFIAYVDWRDTFEALPDDKAGQLIKHLFAYVCDENPHTDDLLINAVFAGIKHTLKRDLKKWEGYIEKQRVNGAKGGRPKKTQKTQPFLEKPKKADSVSVSVSDSVSANGSVARANSDLRFYCRTMFDDEQWQQSIRQVYPRLRKGDNLTLALNQFVSFCESAEKQHDDLADCKGHFTKWMKHQKNTDIPGFK